MPKAWIECPECEGAGDVRHPRWGARNCPSPEIECPRCHGNCEVYTDVIPSCPRCCDSNLRFNPRPWKQYDEGDLFVCGNCGLNGESRDLIDIEDKDV